MQNTILTYYALNDDELLELSGGIRLSFSDRLRKNPSLRSALKKATADYLEALWCSGGKQPPAPDAIMRVLRELGMPGALPESTNVHRAAAAGSAQEQVMRGDMYWSGTGVRQDYAEAVRWYRLAADQGHVGAMGTVASAYYMGKGVERDYREALRYHTLAAEKGHANSQTMLGIMYHKGQGTAKDREKALHYLRLAAAQNEPNAKRYLLRISAENTDPNDPLGNPEFRIPGAVGRNEQLNQLKILDEIAKAKQGDTEAMYQLGNSYSYGWTVKQSKAKAAAVWKMAADYGHAGAQYSLGVLYYNGEGVQQDLGKAVACFRAAADDGFWPAQEMLARLYGAGYGVSKDKAESKYWRKMAEAQKNKER